jgi:hypothetical protein
MESQIIQAPVEVSKTTNNSRKVTRKAADQWQQVEPTLRKLQATGGFHLPAPPRVARQTVRWSKQPGLRGTNVFRLK